jgi:hypothetical protein
MKFAEIAGLLVIGLALYWGFYRMSKLREPIKTEPEPFINRETRADTDEYLKNAMISESTVVEEPEVPQKRVRRTYVKPVAKKAVKKGRSK